MRLKAWLKTLDERFTLRDLREEMLVSAQDLVGRLGLSRDAVWQIERGANHRISSLQRYVEALGGTLIVEPSQEELGALRERAGLTQQEMADRTGMSRSRVSDVENGYYSPQLDTLRRYTAALGRDLVITARFPRIGDMVLDV